MGTQLNYVKHFRDLEVYKRQRELSREVFSLTKRFPAEERYSLTDQIRRSSRSIGAQIAEAWGKRRYPKHFVSKLTDADGEQLETQHWTMEALDANYLNQEQFDSLIGLCEEIGRMLNSMIRKSESFSGDEDALREDASIYGDGDEPCSN
ncbi:MAG: four helix bundle protein [Verrucomicrobiaceae bacterium]|nr:four helix bundle protein [Verrucomicrobiaceae bacterium]